MPWPLSQDYNEAIQNPAQCFSDPELKQGEAVTNALGLPIPCSGNFADVYAVQCGQRKWAVKCFTRQILGLKERYAEVSKYLQQVQLPFMVEFQFLDQGIRVAGQWYPILKMQWVEGFPLNTFVRDNLDKPQVLRTLCQIWQRLAIWLREASLAHCDLQHGNVLLVPGAKATTLSVKLVDYDGMCVPALELLKSTEVGHPSYQHPQRLREGTYGLQIDRFSILVVYTALRGLAVGGRALWEKFDNGDNLLFSQKDFEAPKEAAIFQELLKLDDPEVRKLAQAVGSVSLKPIDLVPFLDQLVPAPKPQTGVVPAASLPGHTGRQTGQGKQSTPPAASVDENPFAAAIVDDAAPRARTRFQAKPKRNPAILVAVCVGVFGLIGGAAAILMLLASRPRATETYLAQGTSLPEQTIASSKATSSASAPSTSPSNQPFHAMPEPKSKTEPEPKPMTEPEPMGKPVLAGREIRRFGKQADQWIEDVTFSPDGKRAMSANGTSISYWDLETGKLIRAMDNPEKTDRCNVVRFLSNGQAISLNNRINPPSASFTVWSLATGKPVRQIQNPAGRLFEMDLSRDGTRLAAGGGAHATRNGQVTEQDSGGRIFDIQSGKELTHFEIQQPAALMRLAISPDGRRVASACAKGLYIWNAMNGKELQKLDRVNGSVAWCPDSRRLVLADVQSVKLWDMESKREVRSMDTDGAKFFDSMCVSKDGRFLLGACRKAGEEAPSPGQPPNFGQAKLWDLGTGRVIRNFDVGTPIAKVALSPDGRRALIAAAGEIILADIEGNVEAETPSEPRNAIDLLKLIDPKRDAVQGTWAFQGETLISPPDELARLQIPYIPPVEYDMKVTAARREGGESFVVGLIVGGKQCETDVDGHPGIGFRSGLNLIDGKSVETNITARKGPVLKNGQSAEIVYSVRKTGVTVTVDGKPLWSYKGDGSRISLPPAWAVPNKRAVFVGSFKSVCHITKMELTPVSGLGFAIQVYKDSEFAKIAERFPAGNDLARSGKATASSWATGEEPEKVFKGDRSTGPDWAPKSNPAWFEARWAPPVEGRRIVIFGRRTPDGADPWGKAAIVVNGAHSSVIDGMSGSRVIVIEFDRVTAIRNLRIDTKGQDHPGIMELEIHP